MVLETGLLKTYNQEIQQLREEIKHYFEDIDMLIRLADYQEENGSCLTESDLSILFKMLQDSREPAVQDMLKSKNLMFGDVLMGHLLRNVPPLKQELVWYVGKLRNLMQ